jgi:hypothetical protein
MTNTPSRGLGRTVSTGSVRLIYGEGYLAQEAMAVQAVGVACDVVVLRGDAASGHQSDGGPKGTVFRI